MTNISQDSPLYVLVPFMRNYSEKITVSKIARELNLPQKTVFRRMEELAETGVIGFEREGRNKKYFLKESRKFLVAGLVEGLKELNFLISHPEVSLLLEEISPLTGVIVFGSYAKGLEKKESDVDLVILSEN